MKPTAAAVMTKKSRASRLRTLPRIKGSLPPSPSCADSLVLVAEAVPDAAHREEVLGGARVPFELLAQVSDVDVDGAGISIRGVAPHLLEKHLAGLHAAGRAGQRGQD